MDYKLTYTIREFGEATGLSKTTTYKLINARELVAIRAAGRTLITGESARAYIDRLVADAQGNQ